MMGYLYILGTILFTLYGQIAVKWRINSYSGLPEGTIEKVIFLLKLLFDPVIFSGFVAAFVSSLFWIAAMTKFELSEVYPIVVGGLALASSMIAIVYLGEQLSWSKVIGLLLIVLGIYIVGR